MKKLPATGTVEIAPSILSADFSRLTAHISEVAPAIKILHLDVMDGHFVPNISFGPGTIQAIRPHSDLFFDTHLMISDPVKYAPEFVKAGSDLITFHLEAVDDAGAILIWSDGRNDGNDVYGQNINSDGTLGVSPACDGDANGDGVVDPLDSGFVLARFGCPVGEGDSNCDAADQNGDGTVDPLDVGYVLARFGTCD